MKKIHLHVLICIIASALFLSACSERNSSQKALYDMQQLVFMAGKAAEQMNIQPDLATQADSLRLKNAHNEIIQYYFDHRDDPAVSADSTTIHDMGRLALASQLVLARYYRGQRDADSVLAAYRRIGHEIPAGRDDFTGAELGLALTYRSLQKFDSTYAIYNRILKDYYPPIDYYEHVNNDVIAIPVDKIKISRSLKDTKTTDRFIKSALDYYGRLKTDYPQYPHLARTASVHTSRVYSMIEQWDKAIAELESLKDSTGQMQIEAMVLIANIYNGPKNDLKRAVDMYEKIIDRKPDSAMIGQMLLRLGVARCAQKDYEDGRKSFIEIKNNFPRSPALMAQTQLYYAQSFTEQNRWERAMSELQWLMESYPYSEEAFRAARMIPEHFYDAGDSKLADIWFDRAIEFYKRAAVNKQGQMTALAAYSYLADTYRRMERWTDAIETLDKIYAAAPKSRLAAKALYNAASISYQQLQDTVKAQEYLDRLNGEFGTTDSTAIHQDSENNNSLESI